MQYGLLAMRASLAAAVLVLAIGCSKREREPLQATGSGSAAPTGARALDVIDGSFTVDGEPAAITACRPGRGVTTFVELVTTKGVLRFEDRQLFWQPDVAAVSRGPALACTQLDRSWGGGSRADGSAYFRGMLEFACTGPAIAGKVTVDCGGITPTERAQLDANRKQLLDEQRGSAATP